MQMRIANDELRGSFRVNQTERQKPNGKQSLGLRVLVAVAIVLFAFENWIRAEYRKLGNRRFCH